jgi:uncharacterized membrane protein YgdD (TMEM256/DUF423 family)
MMKNYILLIGALLGLTSVCAGAYVNHNLVHIMDVKTLSMIKAALHYHELYAVIISVIGLACSFRNEAIVLKLSAWIFIFGTVLFSFSIYLKFLTGAIVWIKLTPIGGTLLMVGWFLLACSSFVYVKKIHCSTS